MTLIGHSASSKINRLPFWAFYQTIQTLHMVVGSRLDAGARGIGPEPIGEQPRPGQAGQEGSGRVSSGPGLRVSGSPGLPTFHVFFGDFSK